MLKETNNPSWTVSNYVGPFSGDGLESVLDIQYGLLFVSFFCVSETNKKKVVPSLVDALFGSGPVNAGFLTGQLSSLRLRLSLML